MARILGHNAVRVRQPLDHYHLPANQKKGRTPLNCRSSPLMASIPYHNIRNIVNPIFLCLITTYATMRQNAAGDIFCSTTQLPRYTIINTAPCATVSLLAYGQIMEIFGAEYGAEIK